MSQAYRWLKRIAAPGQVKPARVPEDLLEDFLRADLVRLYGRGRNRGVAVTEKGRGRLAVEPPRKKITFVSDEEASIHPGSWWCRLECQHEMRVDGRGNDRKRPPSYNQKVPCHACLFPEVV